MCLFDGRNFDPHSSHIFSPTFLKLKTKKHIRDVNSRAEFCKDRSTGGVWANTRILAVRLFFVFFAQRPGRTARPTATNEGSQCVLPAKEVPFRSLKNEKNSFKTPKNSISEA